MTAAAVSAGALAVAIPASAQAADEIIIGFANDVIAISSLRAADDLGLYAKYNIHPKFIYFESASIATSSLIAGSVQFAVGGPSELVAAQAKGQKIVSIGVLYGGVANTLALSKATVDKLGVSPDAPVTERLKALDGLLISAVSPTSAAMVAIRGAVKALGVTPRYSYMSLDAMPGALESGVINGYAAAFPTWAIPVLKGTAVTWLSGPRGDFPPEFSPGTSSVVQTRRDYAQANPDLMKRMVALMSDFVAEMDKNPARVKEAVAKLYPKLDAKAHRLLFRQRGCGVEGEAARCQGLDARDRVHEKRRRHFARSPEGSRPRFDGVPVSARFLARLHEGGNRLSGPGSGGSLQEPAACPLPGFFTDRGGS